MSSSLLERHQCIIANLEKAMIYEVQGLPLVVGQYDLRGGVRRLAAGGRWTGVRLRAYARGPLGACRPR